MLYTFSMKMFTYYCPIDIVSHFFNVDFLWQDFGSRNRPMAAHERGW
jgi:hypothetical protein